MQDWCYQRVGGKKVQCVLLCVNITLVHGAALVENEGAKDEVQF